MELSKEQQAAKGKEIAELLQLKKCRDYPDRYDTNGGNKTDIGLYLTIKRLMEEL